jgi:hypothetical protein
VAILVPAAIVAAIAVSVVGGGRGVGSLGQVLEGPAVPPAEAATRPAPLPRRDERPRTVQATAANPGAPAAAHRGSARSPAARSPATLPLHPRRPGPPPGAPPPPSPAAAPGAQSPPPPPPARPVHDIGSQVAAAVRPLPVAGPVAADAVQAVVALVDPPL